jgi:hypothetical protein
MNVSEKVFAVIVVAIVSGVAHWVPRAPERESRAGGPRLPLYRSRWSTTQGLR